MGRWGSSRASKEPELYFSIVSGLQDLYRRYLLPLEVDYRYPLFYGPLLTDGDFAAKPMVLLLGQYSTGKTTFVQHLLERNYPGQRIGPEPTTDQFVAVMYGDTETTVPGNAAVVDQASPWSQLSAFGNAFLTRFQCAMVNSPLLKGITMVDTPGVLSGNKQSDRGYDFEGVIKWMADRVDLILLMFDAHKLDISDEFRRCINALKGNDYKLRILLNKADMVSPQQLMRVYGALMWSLGKVIPTPEVTRVYIGSFWDAPLRMGEYRKLFEAEAGDLYGDIVSLPRNAALRKLNDFIKRARTLKVHALLMSHFRRQLPLLGKTSKQRDLLKRLPEEFKKVSQEYNIPLGDFPSLELIREKLSNGFELGKILKADVSKRIEALDQMLTHKIPELMRLLPAEGALPDGSSGEMAVPYSPSPFLNLSNDAGGDKLPLWAKVRFLGTPPDVERYRAEFEKLGPDSNGVVTGKQAKAELIRVSGLPSSVLHRVWNLADVTKDGSLDLYEYGLARQFIEMKRQGFDLPHKTPDALIYGTTAQHEKRGAAQLQQQRQQAPPVRQPTSLTGRYRRAATEAKLSTDVAPHHQYQFRQNSQPVNFSVEETRNSADASSPNPYSGDAETTTTATMSGGVSVLHTKSFVSSTGTTGGAKGDTPLDAVGTDWDTASPCEPDHHRLSPAVAGGDDAENDAAMLFGRDRSSDGLFKAQREHQDDGEESERTTVT